MNASTFATDGSYDKIRSDRGYNYEDVVIPSKAPNYDELIVKFYQEHIHTDEEVRYVEEGSGYFDVRDDEDNWVRIECLAGDLIVLPAGIYHRFTLDTKNYVKARRLFIGQPVWTAHNRPCEDMKERKGYVKWVGQGCQGQNVPVV